MAVVDRLSAQLINMDARPIVFAPANLANGVMRVAVGTLEVAAADDSNSIYRLVRVPSNAIIHKVEYACDAVTGLTAHLGVWQTPGVNGGLTVDADHFGSSIALSSALAFTEAAHESAVYGIENVEKPLWEALGLAADSFRMYDIAFNATVDPTAAGTLSLRVLYSTNE